MEKPNRSDSKYWRVVNRYGELGEACRFLEKKFEEDLQNWRNSLLNRQGSLQGETK